MMFTLCDLKLFNAMSVCSWKILERLLLILRETLEYKLLEGEDQLTDVLDTVPDILLGEYIFLGNLLNI